MTTNPGSNCTHLLLKSRALRHMLMRIQHMSVCCTYRNLLQRPTDSTIGVQSRRRGCISVATILVSFVILTPLRDWTGIRTIGGGAWCGSSGRCKELWFLRRTTLLRIGAFWVFPVTSIVGILRFMSCIDDRHSAPTRAFQLAQSLMPCISCFVPAFPFRHGIRLSRVKLLSRVSPLPRFPTERALCFRLQKPEVTRVSVHSKASATATTPHSFFFHAKLRPVPLSIHTQVNEYNTRYSPPLQEAASQ